MGTPHWTSSGVPATCGCAFQPLKRASPWEIRKAHTYVPQGIRRADFQNLRPFLRGTLCYARSLQAFNQALITLARVGMIHGGTETLGCSQGGSEKSSREAYRLVQGSASRWPAVTPAVHDVSVVSLVAQSTREETSLGPGRKTLSRVLGPLVV